MADLDMRYGLVRNPLKSANKGDPLEWLVGWPGTPPLYLGYLEALVAFQEKICP